MKFTLQEYHLTKSARYQISRNAKWYFDFTVSTIAICKNTTTPTHRQIYTFAAPGSSPNRRLHAGRPIV